MPPRGPASATTPTKVIGTTMSWRGLVTSAKPDRVFVGGDENRVDDRGHGDHHERAQVGGAYPPRVLMMIVEATPAQARAATAA